MITVQPEDQLDQTPGSTVTFSVTVTGTVSPTYAWTFNGQGVSDSSKYSGAGTTELTVMGVQTSDEGNYVLLVLDSSAGSPVSFSDPAALSVRKLVCRVYYVMYIAWHCIVYVPFMLSIACTIYM